MYYIGTMQAHDSTGIKNWGFGGYLDDGENIVHIIRPMGNVPIATVILLGIITGGATWALYFWNPTWYWLWLIPLVLGIWQMIHVFCRWYFHAIVLTTENILFTNWKNFLHRSSSRIDYWDLDEIEVERIGMRALLYNYGTLSFVKASGGKSIEYKEIRRPHKKAKLIEHFREEMVHHRNFKQDEGIRDLLSELVGRHVDSNGVSAPTPTLNVRQVRESAPAKPAPTPQQHPERKVTPGVDIDIEKKMDDTGGIDIEL